MRKLKILFLHHNFPAQFKFIAGLSASEGHDVSFIFEKNYFGKIKGVRNIIVDEGSDLTNASIEGQLRCSERFRCRLLELKKEGWAPDVIVSHTGWGCGVHAKAIFPNSKFIAYIEWWFKDDADEYSFDINNNAYGYGEKMKDKLRLRNLSVSYELCVANEIICPSHWQKNQMPMIFQEKTKVIHEGVDIDYFQINHKWKLSNTILMTYATRGMEVMRGFPEFVLATSEVLKEYSNLKIMIAGQDKIFYGGNPPGEGSFGIWAKKIYANNNVLDRVGFLGLLPKHKYARLLKRSNIHCYLTRPFVASWSLLDAMASGCCLIGSELPVVKEFTNNEHTIYTNHINPDDLANKMRYTIELTEKQRRFAGLNQRNKAVSEWSRKSSLDSWVSVLTQQSRDC